MATQCESCRKGYNGRNGNGYQPCSCSRPNARYRTEQRLLLKRPAHKALGIPARAAIEVTVREVTEGTDGRHSYKVTVDEGQIAGLPLWALDADLTERPRV